MIREFLRRFIPIIIPAIGVFFFKWNIGTFLLYFFLDSLCLILITFIKSKWAIQSDFIWKKISYDPKVQPLSTLRYGGLILFLIFFTFSFLTVFFTVGFNGVSLGKIGLALIITALSYGHELFNFISNEIYKKVTMAFCLLESFKRVLVFFVTVILAIGNNYEFMVKAILIMQIVVETYFWNYEKIAERK